MNHNAPPIPKAPGPHPHVKVKAASLPEEEFLQEAQASRERAAFGAWWQAYLVALQARARVGASASDATEYAQQAATAAEVDYRDKVSLMTKRIGQAFGGGK